MRPVRRGVRLLLLAGVASLSREIVHCAQETLHAWAGEPRE
jgi:hypothetical protein